MEPDQTGTPEAAAGVPGADGADEAAAPMSMMDAVGRLTPEQAGLLGVLIGLRRLDDDPPERRP
jgi:hypothetical protein